MSVTRVNRGLVTPVSLSVLLFSFTILTVATYYFAMSSVNNQGGRLNYAAAKRAMSMLESSISSVTWSTDSSVIRYFQGYGGEFETEPNLRRLVTNITFGSNSYVVFNSTVGYARYEMPSVDFGEVGWFLRGDERTVINQSFSEMAQMHIRVSGDDQEIYLGYRPLAVSSLDSSEDSKVNVLRIFIVNLNSSESLLFTGNFRLRVRCANVTTETRNYNLTGQVPLAAVKVTIDSDEGTVYLPLISSGGFTLVRTEILVCSVRLQEVNV